MIIVGKFDEHYDQKLHLTGNHIFYHFNMHYYPTQIKNPALNDPGCGIGGYHQILKHHYPQVLAGGRIDAMIIEAASRRVRRSQVTRQGAVMGRRAKAL